MNFVELNRAFVRIGKDQEPTLEVGRIWGRKYAGWLSWQDLREYRRVALLAEASSGKSAEFRNQADSLRAAGHAAFFVTIEELADHGFEAALEPNAANAFERWRGSTGEAWFFLNSLDEARLNRKSFEIALRRFARVLDDSIDRARIFISCRVSDWKGAEDRVEHERQRAEQEAKDKESWKRFEQALRQDPEQLRDPAKIKSWKAGAYRLWDLTRWLMRRTEAGDETACVEWRFLEEGFGREVAEAYRDGLKLHWRYTKPARPKRTKGGAITFKYTNILAYRAIAVEVGGDPDWTARLSDDEAERAALHGCLSDQGYPEWIDALIASHPRIVLPIIRRAVREEYLSNGPGRTTFLYRYARGAQSLHPSIQKILFNLIASKEPGSPEKFASMLDIAQRLDLATPQRKRLLDIAEARLAAYRLAQNAAAARWYIALLFALDFSKGLSHFEEWLKAGAPAQVQQNAEETFAFLFDSHNPTIPSALANAAVPDLERLLHLVYSYIRPESDEPHEGSYTPNTRDHAENARNAILGAVLNRTGPDAYYALRRVAADPVLAVRAHRFNELARGKAERDCELPAWTAKEVLRFERERTAPVKTGAGLLRVVEGILSDIQFELTKGDVSSRRLLQQAQDEEEVQGWLTEQLNLRSRDRFRAFREAEVAQGDKPDVIVSSTSASCEVAIEIKHSKRWTLRQLEEGLRIQLAENYLKPEVRRYGLLVITHHLARQWRDTETNESMTFPRLIERLASVATTLIANTSGAIEVKCVGIDATSA